MQIAQRVDAYIADHPEQGLERVSHQAIRRWRALKDAVPGAPMVRSVARAYGASVREAMIAAGILAEDDLTDSAPKSDDPLDRAMARHWARLDYAQRSTVVELLKELSRRNKP